VAFLVAKARPVAAAITVDGKIRVLSLPDGREQRAIDLPPGPPDVLSISPDGRFLVFGDHKGNVHVWTSATGATQCELHLRRYPGVGVFSSNGGTLAVAAQGDALQLVDVASCATRVSLAQTVGGVMAAAFSRDGRYIATADGDTAVRVYETGNGRLVSENKDSIMSPLAVDFAPDGRTVVASGGDKVVLFVDAATGRTSRRVTGATEPPFVLQFSPDGNLLATVFMKSEDMSQPDHITLTSLASGAREADWVPPVMPIGGGWTVDGHFIVATASQNTLHLRTLK
jgi:WD40 repeat protein